MKNHKFYLTTPIYYPNDKPHIGSAYTTIAADVLARWYRTKGFKVYFRTGLDEHGDKMAKAAYAAGFKNPKDYCDLQAKIWKELWQALDISYDFFIRTTDAHHEKFVQDFLKKLWERGEIYKGEYKGLYCLGCEEFKEADQLVEGKCPLHKTKPIEIQEKNYFLKLSKYQKKLINLIESEELKLEPEKRKNEVLSFIKKEKLKDVSVSRERVSWGIRVPWDESQTVYCWIDALLNYLSMGGVEYWPCDLHLIGKDILRFHCIIWPVLVLLNGYSLPRRIFMNGFLTVEGTKMSKSLKNVVYLDQLLSKYDSDLIRYYLLGIVPFGQDGDFSEKELKARYNADLANGLGNLVQRVSVMILNNFQGDLRKLESNSKCLEEFEITKVWQEIDSSLAGLQFSEALSSIWRLVDKANSYIEKEKPWVKSEKQDKVLGNLVGIIREISAMLIPFMPKAAGKIQEQFKGPKLKKREILFPRKS